MDISAFDLMRLHLDADGERRSTPVAASLYVRLTPRSSKDEIKGMRADGALKVAVTAPPVDGKANHALLSLLARELGVKRSCVEIASGHSSRDKLVNLIGLSRTEALARLGVADQLAFENAG
jgi:uncharacterized protein (TIGR00251 family)